MRETVLDNSCLRECCGRKPIYRRLHFKTSEFWMIECAADSRHSTGLCHSEGMAVWRWQNRKCREQKSRVGVIPALLFCVPMGICKAWCIYFVGRFKMLEKARGADGGGKAPRLDRYSAGV